MLAEFSRPTVTYDMSFPPYRFPASQRNRPAPSGSAHEPRSRGKDTSSRPGCGVAGVVVAGGHTLGRQRLSSLTLPQTLHSILPRVTAATTCVIAATS